ncbi:MAG: hypothetical protein AAGH40_05590 [Verrucomicrobiota bacterium]
MKKSSALIFLAFILSWMLVPLAAQTEPEQAEPEPEEKELPTEVSDPPYEVGDLVVEQGYYINRGAEQTSINFRIVDNKIRIYWIDSNGLIAEPESAKGSVRFRGSVRGRSFFSLKLADEGSGLIGIPGSVLAPHIYNINMFLEESESKEPLSFSFRYTPSLDAITIPEIPVAQAAVEEEPVEEGPANEEVEAESIEE